MATASFIEEYELPPYCTRAAIPARDCRKRLRLAATGTMNDSQAQTKTDAASLIGSMTCALIALGYSQARLDWALQSALVMKNTFAIDYEVQECLVLMKRSIGMLHWDEKLQLLRRVSGQEAQKYESELAFLNWKHEVFSALLRVAEDFESRNDEACLKSYEAYLVVRKRTRPMTGLCAEKFNLILPGLRQNNQSRAELTIGASEKGSLYCLCCEPCEPGAQQSL